MDIQFKKITDINIENKILFIRTDMNVPLDHHGQIIDDTRIRAGLQTIKYALDNNAYVIVATHLGRPTESVCSSLDSVQVIANYLSKLLGVDVPLIKNINTNINTLMVNAPIDFAKLATNIVMIENVRCNVGEKANSDQLGAEYASLCDVFVHDAFAAAHRAEASTDAIGRFAKEVCAGCLMSAELSALSAAVVAPRKPVVAIVGGAKVSTKLTILANLANKVDYLIVGGGILNTFLAASGFDVAKSLYEPDLVATAATIMQKMQQRGAVVPLPDVVVTSKGFSIDEVATTKHTLDNDDMIMDIGEVFANQLAEIIANCGTVIWNGPMGVFEFDQFALGTKIVAESIADGSECGKCFSLAGGGDTIAAINKFHLFDKISYVSTAGGALLEFLGGAELPALKLLERRCKAG
jgi:phosphoglycerate kinase